MSFKKSFKAKERQTSLSSRLSFPNILYFLKVKNQNKFKSCKLKFLEMKINLCKKKLKIRSSLNKQKAKKKKATKKLQALAKNQKNKIKLIKT